MPKKPEKKIHTTEQTHIPIQVALGEAENQTKSIHSSQKSRVLYSPIAAEYSIKDSILKKALILIPSFNIIFNELANLLLRSDMPRMNKSIPTYAVTQIITFSEVFTACISPNSFLKGTKESNLQRSISSKMECIETTPDPTTQSSKV